MRWFCLRALPPRSDQEALHPGFRVWVERLLPFAFLRAVAQGFVQQGAKAFRRRVGGHVVARRQNEPSFGTVVGVNHKPHLFPYLLRRAVGDDLLHVEPGPEAELPAEFFRDFPFLHGIFLDGVQHVQTNFNEVRDHHFDVSAGVQPEMHAQLMGVLDELPVIGLEKFPEDFQREKGPFLGADVVAGPDGVQAELLPSAPEHDLVKICQGPEQPVHLVGGLVEIAQRVFHAPQGPEPFKQPVPPEPHPVGPVVRRNVSGNQAWVTRVGKIRQHRVQLVPLQGCNGIQRGVLGEKIVHVHPPVGGGVLWSLKNIGDFEINPGEIAGAGVQNFPDQGSLFPKDRGIGPMLHGNGDPAGTALSFDHPRHFFPGQGPVKF